ncbi:hypothetical protein CDD82_6781 [Ophiocordyceps australis]|uniref:Calcineurin-like phosphoesterase domain-containing protein n=1 Tax=Ophiocordyceps australis TaxID=1399860 RepID=A0A2C5YTR2_9HYPO|nr:hypothetical protein CDD82_6781 [Ophiocordyceps australis]
MDSSLDNTERVTTRLLVLSDTCGKTLDTAPLNGNNVDVVVHCGNLTMNSTPSQYQAALDLLRSLDAGLKLVVPGCKDVTLRDGHDIMRTPVTSKDLSSKFHQDCLTGNKPEIRPMSTLKDRQDNYGIVFLGEGNHSFTLANGGVLEVYAGPCIRRDPDGLPHPRQPADWHLYSMYPTVDIAITHIMPYGIMDMSADDEHLGNSNLFTSVARTQPKVHCFGHSSRNWGAEMIVWRPFISNKPNHRIDVDPSRSRLIADLASANKAGDADKNPAFYTAQNFSPNNHDRGLRVKRFGGQTLMVNAALIAEDGAGLTQKPWMVDIQLPLPRKTDEASRRYCCAG